MSETLSGALARAPGRLTAEDGDWDGPALVAACDAAAGWLAARGVARGDRVAWLGLNAGAQVLLTVACARLGAMLAPLNWRLAAEELAWIVADAEPRLIVADETFRAAAEAAAGDVPVHGAEEARSAASAAPPEAGRPEDPCLLVYTSGASGRPKGALLTQAAVLANARLAWDMHRMTAADHVYTVLPLFHVGGLNIQTLPALLRGARATLAPRFEPARCLADIAALRPTLTVQVPATFAALFADPGWAGADLSSLRAVATGSTDVPVPMIEAMHARGVPVIQIYGATETAPVVVYQTPEEALATVGAIGRPGPGVAVRLCGPDGEDLGDGPGEIRVASPTLATGYWRRPDLAEAFAGGAFRTGDVARRDADGLLWFADRVKNVIISGGENIYPAELERVLQEAPGVAEAAVVGVPDDRWGWSPVAVVVPAAGAARDAAAVLARFDGRLARFKRPRDVVFADALPRNAMGKVLVEEVRALARAALAERA